ncbi:RNA-binding protein [Halobacteriales archaeon SW_7_71_33]|nr:MAG: RNA-binding protein [Halobacteriales archaeon SW_7_71_33]
MDEDIRGRVHDLDVTVWVGKAGPDAVVDELDGQLADRELVKLKFLRSARAGADVGTLASGLADDVDAEVVDTRGNTAVLRR